MTRFSRSGLVLAVASLLAVAGAGACSAVLGIGDLDDSGLGGGGASPGSSASGTSSGGAKTTCQTPRDCPPPPTPCYDVKCEDSLCTNHQLPTGTELASQLAGDCKKTVCDSGGNPTSLTDVNDAYDDNNPCTEDKCVGQMPTNTPQVHVSCSAPAGNGYCDATGACVECVGPSDCAGDDCQNGFCVTAACSNGSKDLQETDVDCGGPDCPPCHSTQRCDVGSDCISGVCMGLPKRCVAGTCTDLVKNGTESDVDCGGLGCPKCPDDADCRDPSDCVSGICDNGTCAKPSCTDGVTNEDESDVDCGGAVCPRCSEGDHCMKPGDCLYGGCDTNGVCDHCVSKMKDAGETDVDCGGTCAQKCAIGQACGGGSDCVSTKCCGGKCASTCG